MLSPSQSFRIPFARREELFSISKAPASPPLPPLRKWGKGIAAPTSQGGRGIARSRRHSIARNKNKRLEIVPPAQSTQTFHRPSLARSIILSRDLWKQARSRWLRDPSRPPHRPIVPVRRKRTRRYERIAGPRWHPSHSREIVIQSVMEIRISEPRADGRFRPSSWLAASGPRADRGRCRRGRVAAWGAVPPGSCARPSAPS